MKKAKQAFEESIATDNFRYVCQADSVKYLELCDKYFIGWLRKQAPGRAQNPLAGLAAFDAERQKCFCVTFDKSNKTYSASDVACWLVFGWNMVCCEQIFM